MKIPFLLLLFIIYSNTYFVHAKFQDFFSVQGQKNEKKKNIFVPLQFLLMLYVAP